MKNFKFHNPTKIIFGKETIQDLASEIPKEAKVMITYGGGSIKNNGVFDAVLRALEGFEVGQFGGIEPNPSYETLMRCVEIIRKDRFDFLLAVGGGSVIDGTKFIAAAVAYPGDAWEVVKSGGKKVEQCLPFGTVLTLPASGSEMNSGAVITNKGLNAKLPFSHTSLYPRFSVLDPTVTYSLPPVQVANGIVDAFVHVTEQYLTYSVNAKLQDRFAEGLLLTLIEEGPKALSNPLDYDVRANIMWCAAMALNGLISAGVPQDWATHMIGHELTLRCGLDHAKTLAIVLPAMLKVRAGEKHEKLLQYADRVWGITTGSEEARIEGAIEKTRAFFESLEVPTRLCDYNVTEDVIPAIVEQLKEHDMTKLGENKNVTPDVAYAILKACL